MWQKNGNAKSIGNRFFNLEHVTRLLNCAEAARNAVIWLHLKSKPICPWKEGDIFSSGGGERNPEIIVKRDGPKPPITLGKWDKSAAFKTCF